MVTKYRGWTKEECSRGGKASLTNFKKGHSVPQEWRIKAGQKLKGRKRTPEQNAAKRLYVKRGKDHYLYGKNIPEELCIKWSLVRTKEKEFTGFRHKGRKRIMNKLQYKYWRNAVFKRDNYRCQFCCKRGKFLNAHHIRTFAKYPELRFRLSNGITLCKDCHAPTIGNETFYQMYCEWIVELKNCRKQEKELNIKINNVEVYQNV